VIGKNEGSWPAFLNQDPQAIQFLATEVAGQVNSIAQDVDLPEADTREWINAYTGWTKGSLIKAIQQHGLEKMWRDEANAATTHLLSLSAHGQSEAAVKGQQIVEILIHVLLEVLIESEVACANPGPNQPTC
jgi:hypothetical protein